MTNTFFGDGKATGFRLKKLEMYNWGLINGNTEVDVEGDSFLVSGANGSGKTSLVDALQCLLIQKNFRYYNASTEDAKKFDRSETTYLLGKISEVGTEDMFLRKRDTVGMLLAGFDDLSGSTGPLTLFAMLWFRSSTGAPQIKYGIARTALSLKEICGTVEKEGASMTPGSTWASILTKKYGMLTYGEGQYHEYFANLYEILGFRNKSLAPKLFASLIGKRNLQDTQAFIREGVLDEDDDDKKKDSFDDLLERFQKSIELYNKVRRNKKKAEVIGKVHEALEAYDDARSAAETARLQVSAEMAWYDVSRSRILQERILSTKNEIDTCRSEMDAIRKEAQKLDDDITEITVRIAENGDGGIDAQRTKVNQLLDKLENRRQALRKFSSDLDALAYSSEKDIARPSDAKSFRKFLDDITSMKSEFDELKKKLFDDIGECRAELSDLGKRRKEIEAEIRYQEEHTESIPSREVAKRDALSRMTGIPKDMLPFGGELIEIRENADKWDAPLRHLFKPFALTIVASEEYEAEIRKYMASMADSERLSLVFADMSVPRPSAPAEGAASFVNVKDDSPYTSWVHGFIRNRYGHVLAEDLEEIAEHGDGMYGHADAVHISGLECTDDIFSTPGTSAVPYCYGWKDNLAYRTKLKEDLSELDAAVADKEKDLRSLTAKYDKALSTLSTINSISGYWTSWDEIDVETIRIEYEDENVQLKQLEESDPNKALRARMSELKRLKAENETLKTSCIYKTGSYETTLQGLREKLGHISVTEEKTSLAESYEKAHPKCCGIDYEAIEALHNDLRIQEEKGFQTAYRKINDCKDLVEKAMRAFTNPKFRPEEKDLDWSGDYTDIGDTLADREWYEKTYSEMAAAGFSAGEEDMYRFIETNMLQQISDYENGVEKKIKRLYEAVRNFNETLGYIPFNEAKGSHLQLRIKEQLTDEQRAFNGKFLKCAIDPQTWAYDRKTAIANFTKNVIDLIKYYSDNERIKDSLTDIRMRFEYIVEAVDADGNVLDTYKSTNSRSGGEKAKITYTLLAASVAYQFRLTDEDDRLTPLRFVILDEAFAASDNANSKYVLELFRKMDVQVMVVTPNDKVYIAVDYVGNIIFTARNEHTGTGNLVLCNSEDRKILKQILEEKE